MKPVLKPGMDPLSVIFEQHLYHFTDANIDRKTFIQNIINDYMGHMRSLQLSIPKNMEHLISEELYDQVNTMLIKKIYGHYSIKDHVVHVEKSEPVRKKKARARYQKLKSAS
jgi:hypothetical protein